MTPKFSKSLHWIGYVGLFLATFVFFLYMTFPYEVLKESLGTQIGALTGYKVRFESFGPRLFFGVRAKNIHVDAPNGDASFVLSQLTAKLNPFSLLLGHLSGEVDVLSGNGHLDADFAIKLFPLLKGDLQLTSISLHAKDFPLDEMVTFMLTSLGSKYAESSDPQQRFAGPMLSKLGFGGKLNSDVSFDLDPGDLTQSKGRAEVKFVDATLKFKDPALKLSDQKFVKAQIISSLGGGKLDMDKDSGFKTQEFDLQFSGSVKLKPTFDESTMDLTIALKLDKGLKETFGILTTAFGAAQMGEVTWKLRGPAGHLETSTF